MAKSTQAIEAPTEEAQSWLRYSLGQGFDISAAVLDAGFIDRGRALAIVSKEFQGASFNFSQGKFLSRSATQQSLVELLDRTFATARSVLVEDELRRRNDPHVAAEGQPAAFIEDRVIHWCDLSKGATAAVDAIVQGAWGYPTNAFVLAKSSGELGLMDRKDAPKDLVENVLSSLRGVVVSAFDDESYLIWVPDRDSSRGM